MITDRDALVIIVIFSLLMAASLMCHCCTIPPAHRAVIDEWRNDTTGIYGKY